MMQKNNDANNDKEIVQIGEAKFGRTTYEICCCFAKRGKTFEEKLLSLAKKEKFE